MGIELGKFVMYLNIFIDEIFLRVCVRENRSRNGYKNEIVFCINN